MPRATWDVRKSSGHGDRHNDGDDGPEDGVALGVHKDPAKGDRRSPGLKPRCGDRNRRASIYDTRQRMQDALRGETRGAAVVAAVARTSAVNFTPPAVSLADVASGMEPTDGGGGRIPTPGLAQGNGTAMAMPKPRFNAGFVLLVATVLVIVIVVAVLEQPKEGLWRVLGSFASSLCAILVWDIWLSSRINR